MTHCVCTVYICCSTRWWIVKLYSYAPRSTWQLFGRIVLACFTDQFIRTWTFWLDFFFDDDEFFFFLLVCSFSIIMRLFTDFANSPILFSFIHSMLNWPESLKDQMLDVYLIISNANIRRKFKTEKYLRFESICLSLSGYVRARERIHGVFFAVNLSSQIE